MEFKKNQEIYFGDLEDLFGTASVRKAQRAKKMKTTNSEDRPSIKFFRGNYTISSLSPINGSNSPIFALCQENLDANLIFQRCLPPTTETIAAKGRRGRVANRRSTLKSDNNRSSIIDRSSDSESDSDDSESGTETKSRKRQRIDDGDVAKRFFGPEKWRKSKSKWPKEFSEIDTAAYRHHASVCAKKKKRGSRCLICDWSGLKWEGVGRQPENVEAKKKWFAVKILEKITEDTHDQSPLKLADLVFFVNNIDWMKKERIDDLTITATKSDHGVTLYRLEMEDDVIGIAFEASECYGLAVDDSDENGCLAFFVCDSKCYQSIIGAETPARFSVDEFIKNTDRESIDNGTEYQFSFEKLPGELLFGILDYLSWRERARCRRISKYWSVISDQALSIATKHLDLNDTWSSSSHSFHWGKRHEGTIGVKNLKPFQFDRLLSAIGPNLQTIRMGSKIPLKNLLNAPAPLKSMQTIDYQDCKNLEMATIFGLLDKCPNLKILTGWPVGIKKSGDYKYSSKTSDLEMLILGSSEGMTGRDLEQISIRCPKLTRFAVCDHENLTKAAVASLVRRCTNLTHLQISSGLVKNVGRSMNIDLSHCQKLIDLDFSGTNIVDDHLLISLSTWCPDLEDLDIAGAQKVTNKGVESLAQLTKLKKLDINSIGADLTEAVRKIGVKGKLVYLGASHTPISPGALKAVLKHCISMEELDVSYNPKLFRATDAAALIRTRNHPKYVGLDQTLMIRCSGSIWHKPAALAALDELSERFGDPESVVYIECDYREWVWMAPGEELDWGY